MKSILVTGGAGFIGSHVVVELVAAGYRPIIIDNFSNSEKSVIANLEKLLSQTVTHYDQDYRDANTAEIITAEDISGIIHFAAYKQVSESVNQPLKYYDNNVAGFVKLLQMLEASPVKNIVFSSSCTVYGEPDSLPVTELSPVKPATSPYGASKQMDEVILHDTVAFSQHSNALALRYFNPIGAHPSALIGELPLGVPANLIPYVTQTAAGIREKLTVNGTNYDTADGSNVRDYIHVVDLAKAHIKALQYLETQAPQSFDFVNVGTGKGSSVLEVISTFQTATGVTLPYEIGPRRPGDIIATYADATKAKNLLGWQAEKTLTDALVDAWRWQQTLPS